MNGKFSDNVLKYIFGKRFYFMLMCLFTTGFYNSKAEIQFSSERLRKIFYMLPEVHRSEITNRLSSNSDPQNTDGSLITDQYKIVYRFNQYQELEHLGLNLIIRNRHNEQLKEVCDYVERAFLVSVLQHEKFPFSQAVNQNKIEVLYNGSQLNTQNPYWERPAIIINKDTPVKIYYDSKHFFIKWKLDSVNILEVNIPNNYSFITEKTKDEMERDILRKFKEPVPGKKHYPNPAFSQLELFKENIYFLDGEMYFFVTDLSSDKYYFVNDSIRPVFHSRYYKESVSNLFLNVIPTNLDLNITQKLYGGNDVEFRININHFFETFTPEFRIYFGWLNDDKEDSEATILISNKVYNYNHLLKISVDAKSVFRKSGEIDGLFFAYIPRENLN